MGGCAGPVPPSPPQPKSMVASANAQTRGEPPFPEDAAAGLRRRSMAGGGREHEAAGTKPVAMAA